MPAEPSNVSSNIKVLFSEASPQVPESASLRDVKRSTAAAELAGWRVVYIPQELPESVTYDDVLWHLPKFEEAAVGIWAGYIPLPAQYEAFYQAAAAHEVFLINSPEEFRKGEEFHLYYPLIRDLTPASWIVQSPEECEGLDGIRFPVFAKGTVQSLKSSGLSACRADNLDELRQLTKRLLGIERRSLGRVIVREFVRLRHSRVIGKGFPAGREYRVFVYCGRVVELGYYWEGDDPLAELNVEEARMVTSLAEETSRRLAVPWLAIDIGQLESGEWIVIECGDAQFSGISQTPIHPLWHKLSVSLGK